MGVLALLRTNNDNETLSQPNVQFLELIFVHITASGLTHLWREF